MHSAASELIAHQIVGIKLFEMDGAQFLYYLGVKNNNNDGMTGLMIKIILDGYWLYEIEWLSIECYDV